MSNLEQDLLTRDLSKAETKEEVERVVEDAELLGHEDIVGLAKQKLEAISAKAHTVETTAPSQNSQVESVGGSTEEVEKRTEAVDSKIDEVKAEAEQEIAEVGGVKKVDVKIETPESAEEKISPSETNKISPEEKQEIVEKAEKAKEALTAKLLELFKLYSQEEQKNNDIAHRIMDRHYREYEKLVSSTQEAKRRQLSKYAEGVKEIAKEVDELKRNLKLDIELSKKQEEIFSPEYEKLYSLQKDYDKVMTEARKKGITEVSEIEWTSPLKDNNFGRPPTMPFTPPSYDASLQNRVYELLSSSRGLQNSGKRLLEKLEEVSKSLPS